MSQFIEDGQLRDLVADILGGRSRAVKTATEIADRIKRHDAYVERGRCSCPVNRCECKVTTPTRPHSIEAGDGFEQLLPDGQILRLHALGVRRDPNTDEPYEIFTAGWPPMIVRIPEHGSVKLLNKGTGITKEELRHRREKIGGGWEDDVE